MTAGSLSGGNVSKASVIESMFELFAHIRSYEQALRASLGRKSRNERTGLEKECQGNAADNGLLKDCDGGANKK